MRKLLEHKLNEFADIRKYANGMIRKQMIDQEVRVYLAKRCPEVKEYVSGYKYYQEKFK